MNLAQKIAKESTITFTGMLYGNINRYIYIAILARWVSVEYLGIYSLANAIMMIGEVIAKMGLETGVMRFVSRLDVKIERQKIQNIIMSSLKMTGIFSVIISIILAVSSGVLVSFFKVTDISLLRIVMIVFIFTIPFNAITQVAAHATQGFKLLKYKIMTTQLLNPTVLLLSMLLFLFFSDKSAIIIPMAVTGITGCFVMIYLLKNISGIQLQNIIVTPFDNNLFNFSCPLMFVAILQTFMHFQDILMLGYLVNEAETVVGLYHPAARTAGLFQILIISFLSIYAPMMSQLHAKGDFKEMSHLYKLVSRWLITSSIPIMLIFIIYPAKIMLLFGENYLPSQDILVMLSIGMFIQTTLGAAGPALSMSGHTRIVLWNSLSACVLNFILNMILIPKYAGMGAAWATFISLTVLGLVRVIEVRFILNLSIFSIKLIKPLLATCVTGYCIISMRPYVMNYHTLVTLLLVFLMVIIIYGLSLWLLKFEPEDKDFLSGLNILGKSLKNDNGN